MEGKLINGRNQELFGTKQYRRRNRKEKIYCSKLNWGTLETECSKQPWSILLCLLWNQRPFNRHLHRHPQFKILRSLSVCHIFRRVLTGIRVSNMRSIRKMATAAKRN